MKPAVIVTGLLLVACTNQTAAPALPDTLLPYSTITPSATPETSQQTVLPAEPPIPSPTPFAYIIQAGDTMSEIAEKYHVSLDDLIAANPNVSPNSMTVGQTLLIPSEPVNPENASTPTPVPAPVKEPDCYLTADRGLWCFAPVHNNLPEIMENVSAQVTLIDSNGVVAASQIALLPLNILPPNASLPLYVFFPPEVPPEVRVQVHLLTAIRIPVDDPRYLPAAILEPSVQIDRNGRSAHVSGVITLPVESTAAARVWVAAVAYDRGGHVVGVRRWEGGGIQPGDRLSFSFALASAGPEIGTVEFVAEARP